MLKDSCPYGAYIRGLSRKKESFKEVGESHYKMTKYKTKMVTISINFNQDLGGLIIFGSYVDCQCMKYQENSELGDYIKSLHQLKAVYGNFCN